MSSVLVIANPNAGDRGAPKLIEEVVLPLLKAAGVEFTFHKTESGKQAGELAHEHLARKAGPIIVGGGDGSVHELLNYVYLDAVTGTGTKSDFPLSLILLPLGTANAVYASFWPPSPEDANFSHPLLQNETPPEVVLKLRSVLAFIDKKTTPQPLAITLAQIYGPPEGYIESPGLFYDFVRRQFNITPRGDPPQCGKVPRDDTGYRAFQSRCWRKHHELG